MMHLQLIPLKTPDGQAFGHARVQDGFVSIRAQGGSAPSVLILTDNGTVSGSSGVRLHISGVVQAVALHTRGQLQCCGFARECPYGLEDVRKRLNSMFATEPPHPDAQENARPAEPDAQSAPASADALQEEAPAAAHPGADAHHEAVDDASIRVAAANRQPPPAAPVEAPPSPSLTERARRERRNAPQRRTCPRMIPAEPLLVDESGCVVDTVDAFEAAATPASVIMSTKASPARPIEAPAAPTGEPEATAPEADILRPCANAAPPPRETDATPAPEADVQHLLQRLKQESAAAFIPAGQASGALPLDTPEDSAMRAESFAALLHRCDAVFEKIAAAGEAPAIRAAPAPDIEAEAQTACRVPAINPFPHIFPGAQFFRESDQRGTEMLLGHWRRGMESFTITAVRGEYSPRPPAFLPGFTRYIRTRQGGFWVRVEE